MNGLTLKLFFIAFFIFIVIDTLWLGVISKRLYIVNYQPWLRLISGELKPLWWAALIVYLLFPLSIVVFIAPLAQHSPYLGALYGAILGGVIYGVYDLTCLAIFKDFPVGMGLIDWLWGTVLYTASSFLSIYCVNYLK